MHRKIKTLITRSEFNIQRSDFLLLKKENEHRILSLKIEHLSDEMQAIAQLGRSLYPSGEINKEKLFGIQRRQAALKRKVAELKMQQSQIILEKESCEKEKVIIADKRKALLRQMDKYEYLFKLERKKKRLKDARVEESEIEERVSWQK